MDYKAQTIKNRLSLRKPQTDSLEILSKLVEVLELKKDVNVVEELAKVRQLYPICSDFERDFPSVCFALATGVGKTRLMGAFISYLYITKGIKNFFVLAPNLTVYNKLNDDLSNPNSPKYVFKGIAEFAVNAPRIVTGDNYQEVRQGQGTLFQSIDINIFNISKINAEVRAGAVPRIKKLSEYIGESYFDYLSGLPDLVLLMDESHHYRANAGLRALNELKPVLGLELTATPIDPKGNKFKNVVFDYPLALALRDGFVKQPAIATRKDFRPEQYLHDPKELDLIKLEDGLRIHEDIKVGLEIYARDNNKPLVRPFVLVVSRDTEHAGEILALINSDKFFKGQYAGKVMEIHSNQRGEEKEENIEKLLLLEKPQNNIEIVIHVNMLKEGWDVTNLYTIIPLRAANSQILTEQTIGRGLRLPYGERTGVDKVDKLVVIAHDKFQAIVDEANKPGSIIRKENIIEINPDDLARPQQVIVSRSVIEEGLIKQRQEAGLIVNAAQRQEAGIGLDARQEITNTLNSLGSEVKSLSDLSSEEMRIVVEQKAIERIKSAPQMDLFQQERIEEIKKQSSAAIQEFIEKIIPIPRVYIHQKNDAKCGFHDFDLEVMGLNYPPVSEEIIIKTLGKDDVDYLKAEGSGVVRDTSVNIIINELINYPEIDYDREANLLYKIANQAVDKLGSGKSEKDLRNIILYHKRDIGKYIYVQMQSKFFLEQGEFEDSVVLPFTKIEPHNLSRYTQDKVFHFSETITPTNTIPSKVFGGFAKACHNLYKFDSKTEKDFTVIMEQDKDVIKWLRPALAQFSIYWQHNSRRYTPDFVVETVNSIFMIEIKAEIDIDDNEVKEKADAGKKYCDTVTEYNLKNSGKPWEYVLIPHTAVAGNMSFTALARNLDV